MDGPLLDDKIRKCPIFAAIGENILQSRLHDRGLVEAEHAAKFGVDILEAAIGPDRAAKNPGLKVLRDVLIIY